MLTWNKSLFLLLNAPAGASPIMVKLAAALAASPVFVVPLVLVWLWVRARPPRRSGLLVVALGVGAALGFAHLLGFAWYEQRPFMIGLGRTLAQHKVENSFPSDHATLAWSLAFGLLATGVAPVSGAALVVFGLGVAWARIYLGLHFPLDMLGAALAAAGGVAAALGLRPLVLRASPSIERVYVESVRGLRLPASLFPR